MKYPLRPDAEYNFMIFPDDHDALFVFGAEETDEGRMLRDLVCTKKDVGNGYCHQYSFNYGTEENALLGKMKFQIKSIFAFQLLNRYAQPTMDFFEITKRIKILTGMSVSSIVFDSSKNSWAMHDSSFKKRLDGRKNICIIIENKEGIMFGGYVPCKIKTNKWTKDPNCFLFSMRKDGIFELNKYKLLDNAYDFWLGDTNEDILFAFGGEDYEDTKTQIFKDIVIHKKDSIHENYCDQCSFDYKNCENTLIGKRELSVNRIIIYQLQQINQDIFV